MLRCLPLVLCLLITGLADAQKITSFETAEEVAVLQPGRRRGNR
jgi:hypothetical protein